MKVKVRNLESNPFRNMPEYPIDEAKVQTLMKSIKSTTFWDNILARKHNGKIQIAYGHHRWVALKRLRIKEVDIPVRKLSDEQMLRIMAEENLQEYDISPAIINETVKAAKEYLIMHGRADEVAAVGISDFLGGNWNRMKIERALEQLGAIDEKRVDKKAIGSLSTQFQAEGFVKSVDRFAKVTGEKPKAIAQRKVAKKLRNGDIAKTQVYEHLVTEQYPGAGKRTVPKVDFANYISETAEAIIRLTRKLTNIRQVMKKYPKEQMPEEAMDLFSSVNTLIMELKELAAELKRRKPKQKLLT